MPYLNKTLTIFDRNKIPSACFSYSLCVLLVLILLGIFQELIHWFILPVFLCGILIGIDAVRWFRGRLGIYDPIGIIGLLGLHFFFLAPLLHVISDRWMSLVIAPPDWRDWLGWMAILNFIGLVCYRYFRRIFERRVKCRSSIQVWRLDSRRFLIISGIAMILTASLQLSIFAQFGGITGYMEAYESAERAFEGKGWVFMLSEAFPIIAFMMYINWLSIKQKRISWCHILFVLIIFLGLQLIFGGLRGSRSNTIWALFWAVGIIHFWIRPIPKKFIYSGLIFLVFFMYFYGFYKGAGREGFSALIDSEIRKEMEYQTGRTIETTLLGDLGRSDVQAFLLYRIWKYPQEYDYAFGQTYLGAIAMLIPKQIISEKLPGKRKWGTDAQFGKGLYSDLWSSSRIYGLAGEAMLNFGPFFVPISFIILGAIVGKTRFFIHSLSAGDPRLLWVPLLIILCFNFLTSDLGNVIFIGIKNGLLPIIIVTLSSKITMNKKMVFC